MSAKLLKEIKATHAVLLGLKIVKAKTYPDDFEEAKTEFDSMMDGVDTDGMEGNKKKEAAWNDAVELHTKLFDGDGGEEEEAEEEEAEEEEGEEEAPAKDKAKASAKKAAPGNAKEPAKAKAKAKAPVKDKAKAPAKKAALGNAKKPAKDKAKAKAPAKEKAKARSTVPRDVFGFGVGTKNSSFGKMLLRKKGSTMKDVRDAEWNDKGGPYYNVFKGLVAEGLAEKTDDGRMIATDKARGV